MVKAHFRTSFCTKTSTRFCTECGFALKETALQNHDLWSCMPFLVEFEGESQRSKFKQEHRQIDGRKWPKSLGWRRRGLYYVTGARYQKFEAAEWSWIWPGVIGFLRQVAYELITADHEHFESLAWPCMIARWYHWRHKRLYVQFFHRLFDCLPLHFSTSDLDHQTLQKSPFYFCWLKYWHLVPSK